VIHGHSSHHPRPVEVYRGRLVLYGCGDAINDYEGVSGHEESRGDLRPLYFASLAADTGQLAALQIVATQARKMRLRRAGTADSQWMQAILQRISHPFGSRIRHQPDGVLTLQPPASDHPR
jgi:poly-gamma-glutamate synthesis protein (capsule biosynthesis protein)